MSSSTLTAVNDQEQAMATIEAPPSPPSCEPRTAEPRGGGSGLTRITVNLSHRSVAALDNLVDLTQETKTDSINKALQVYAYIQQLIHDGGTLYIRDSAHDDLERLHIL